MSKSTTFVSGKQVWEQITAHVRKAGRVRAAIAYVGEAEQKLLPLGKGDQLVVDLSMPTVRAGVTNPFVIERFIRRGVTVSSRPGLHAKVVVAGRTAIIGSANASGRSASVLEEAAVITEDPGTVRAAMAFIDAAALEPVGPEYLKLCKKNYRPPRQLGGISAQSKPAPKLWIVNLDGEWEVPERESERFDESVEAAEEKRRLGDAGSTMDSFTWGSKPGMADVLRLGHWILMMTRYADGTVDVKPPMQFLWLDRYSRGKAKLRYVFHVEGPKTLQSLSWPRFRRALPPPLRARYPRPRTRAVSDAAEADLLMSLWTLGGRFRGKR